MHDTMRLAAVCAVLFLAACGDISKLKDKYIQDNEPVMPKHATTLCGPGSPLLDADRDALCAQVTAFGEPKLPEGWAGGTGAPVYRVLMLSPSQPSYAIRVEDKGQAGTLTVKKMSGGRLVLTRSVPLTDADVQKFLMIFDKDGFWSTPVTADVTEMPTKDDDDEKTPKPCTAGIAFVAEGYTHGRYHAARGHCQPLKGLEEIATGTFDFAATKVPELQKSLQQSLD